MARARTQQALLVSLALGAGVLVLCSGAAQTQVLRVAEAFGRLRPGTVFLVLLLTAVSTLIAGGMWSRLLSKMGCHVPVSAGMSAFAGSGLAGYLVNAAGSAVGGVVSLRRHGISSKRAVIATLLANALGLCGVLVWAPFGLVLVTRPGMSNAVPLLGKYGTDAAPWLCAGLVLIMVVTVKMLTSAEGVGRRALGFCLRRRAFGAAGEPPVATCRLRVPQLLDLLLWSAVAWLASTLALFVMLAELGASSGVKLTDVIGASVVAAIFGSVAFFVPAGVGVRDGVLVALLAHSTGVSVASCTAAALAVRALDPLSKFGLLLVLASGLWEQLSQHYRQALAIVGTVRRPESYRTSPIILARLSRQVSNPLLEVVQIEQDYPA